eukprot:4084978-Prymnesium_polylepis.1
MKKAVSICCSRGAWLIAVISEMAITNCSESTSPVSFGSKMRKMNLKRWSSTSERSRRRFSAFILRRLDGIDMDCVASSVERFGSKGTIPSGSEAIDLR